MKIYPLLVVFVLTTTFAFSQNKEKIKGSKVVIEKPKEIEEFTTLEIEDNLTVFLEKGSKSEIKIEADDNLHENIAFDLKEKTLRIYTPKELNSYKKLVIHVKYTNDLKKVIAKNQTIINAVEAIQLDDITFTTNDYAKLYLNVNSKKATFIADDKTKIELNLKSEKSKIQLSKNAQIKALISATDLAIDLYQKTTATIEGDASNAVIRQDNNSVFNGFNFTIKNADVTTESSAVSNIMSDTTLVIDANDTSKINLQGTPKIEVRKFLGEAQLLKKVK
jgi:tRNA A37 threonylcarbamoyladenosine synthetase subunit TsaC/SUA5/YrdC